MLGEGEISPFRLLRGWVVGPETSKASVAVFSASGHHIQPAATTFCSHTHLTHVAGSHAPSLPQLHSFSHFLRQAGQIGGQWKGQRKSERGPGGWCWLLGEHLKSLPLKKSQAEVWHSTARPSVGLSIIDFSQNAGGVESSPREVMNFSASWNIFSGFQCCGEEQVRGALPRGVEQAGAVRGQALTWIRMIFVMSSGGLSGKGRTRSKILTQD